MKKGKYLSLLLVAIASASLVGCNTTTNDSSSSAPTSTSSEPVSSSSSTSQEEVSSSTSSEEETSTSSIPVVVTHTITVNAPDGVVANVKQEASKDETVLVSLTYDETKLVIDSVKANNVECGLTDAKTYYFVMPNEDVNIVITAHAKDNVVTHNLAMATEGVSLIGVQSSYKVGDKVSFKLAAQPGYVINGGVEVVPSDSTNTQEITLTTSTLSGETIYEFTMPDFDVNVKCDAVLGVYSITCDDELIDRIYEIVDDEEVSIKNAGVATYKSTIKVTLESNDYKKATGVRIVETGQEIMLLEGEDSITFTMPHRNITLEAISVDYLRTVVVNSSEHITLTTYKKLETGEMVPSTSFLYDEDVYVKADPVSDEWTISELMYTYGDSSYNDTELDEGDLEDGYYVFSMPRADTVTISVTEKNIAMFLDAPFIGTYLGLNVFGSSSTPTKVMTSFSASYGVRVTKEGLLYKGSSSYPTEYEITTFADGVAQLANGGVFAYSDKIIFSQYSFNSLTANDNIVAVKKLNEDDSDDLYKVEAVDFDNRKYQAIQFYRDDQPYAAAFIDIANGKYYLDVTFELQDGATSITSLTGDQNYNVLVGEKAIYNVGVVDGEMKTIDAVKGTYTNTDTDSELTTLVLDGVGKATLGDKTGLSYSVTEDGKIKITEDVTVYTITLDDTTFTIESVETVENNVIGKTFSGEYVGSTDDTYTLSIEFVDATKCYVLSKGGSIDYIGGSAARDNLENQTYTISANAEGQTVITATTWNFSNEVTLVMVLSEDGNTLTVTNDATNVYTTAGTVLTIEVEE